MDHDGAFAVGTDIVPGIYTSAGPVGKGACYWKRLGPDTDGKPALVDNAMSKKPQMVRIDPTDKTFKTDGCQPWQKNDAAIPDPGKTPGRSRPALGHPQFADRWWRRTSAESAALPAPSRRAAYAGMETVEYAAGRLVDVFGAPAQPTVLLWHGQQARRARLGAAACRAAGRPWLGRYRPRLGLHADDGGRADLLRSVHFARERVDRPRRSGTGRLVDGRSRGGRADDSGATARHRFRAHRLPCRRVHGAPIRSSVEFPATQLERRSHDVARLPCCTAYPTRHPVAVSHDFASALRHNDWPVQVVELPADHGSIAGASYDASPAATRLPNDAQTLAVAADVAARIAAVLGWPVCPSATAGDWVSQSRSFA